MQRERERGRERGREGGREGGASDCREREREEGERDAANRKSANASRDVEAAMGGGLVDDAAPLSMKTVSEGGGEGGLVTLETQMM